MPGDRQNTSIIENNYARESVIIQQEFEKGIKKLGNYLGASIK